MKRVVKNNVNFKIKCNIFLKWKQNEKMKKVVNLFGTEEKK